MPLFIHNDIIQNYKSALSKDNAPVLFDSIFHY